MNKNIFVACDVSSQKEILNLLELIHEDISGIKIGLQYITQHSPEEIKELSNYSVRKEEISIVLEDQKILFGNKEIKFEIDQFKKKCLIEGLDDIALSLEQKTKIEIFEKDLKSSKPWIFND